MPTYAIGDIQGCFEQFQQLLAAIHFDAKKDTLWFTGDLVNRGQHSLEVLRFIKSLGDKHKIVLGNHDLHLLAVAYGVAELKTTDTIDAILTAPDRRELLEWYRLKPLLHYDENLNLALVHAGIAPFWDIRKALALSREVEKELQGPAPEYFLENMYGTHPAKWDDELSGIDRLRCITNYLTRMRLCHRDGCLELSYKGTLENKPKDLLPWFDVPGRRNKEIKIIFGHWAALGGKADVPDVFPLDTGCVWGNSLTAMRLEDQERFSVSCGSLCNSIKL